jgi:hypothetical protein
MKTRNEIISKAVESLTLDWLENIAISREYIAACWGVGPLMTEAIYDAWLEREGRMEKERAWIEEERLADRYDMERGVFSI